MYNQLCQSHEPLMMRDAPFHLDFDMAEIQSCQEHDFGSKPFEMFCRAYIFVEYAWSLSWMLEDMRVQYEVV